MKKCVNCNINVGGDIQKCPICQNALTGEASENIWPPMTKLRLQSIFYKLQLFLVLALAFVSLALDFLLDIYTRKHWSLPVVIWAISMELLIRHFLKKSVVAAAIVTDSAIHISILLIFTGWYMGFLAPIVMWIIPIAISLLLITNLIFSLIDVHGNALVYLLANILIGLIPYIVLYFTKIDIPLTWTICLMITVITFIGICVFKGRSVLNEVQKRMSI